MSNQPAFDVNLAFRLAKMSSGDGGDGGGGGGSAAHMPIPGGEGEMGAVGGSPLHDMVSNWFDCLGEMGKFPGVFADWTENALDSLVSGAVAGIDSSLLDNLTHGFKKMVLNVEMHGLQPISGINEMLLKSLGTSVVPGFINPKNEGR
jgi:hypothetical protein